MFDYILGTIKEVDDKSIILETGQIGYSLLIPNTKGLTVDAQQTLYAYMHWNSENGPSLFGFQTQLERKVFLLIIGCSKIGPSIALSILSTFSAAQFLEIITTHDDKQLSTVPGIGAKKAEQIIVQLKHKVQKMISAGLVVPETQESFVQWQNVSDVLNSLNYSNQEISQAIQHLTEKYKEQNCSLDQLIRSALSFLSGSV